MEREKPPSRESVHQTMISTGMDTSLLDMLLTLSDERWDSKDIERIAKVVCPEDIAFPYDALTKPPRRLVTLLDYQESRAWASRILFVGMPRQRDKVPTWSQVIDRDLLRIRPSDSSITQIVLTGLRIAVGDTRDIRIAEVVPKFVDLDVRSSPIVLRRLYKSAPKDRIVDDFITSVALEILATRDAQRDPLTNLVAEVLSARESQLADREVASTLKLPEMIIQSKLHR